MREQIHTIPINDAMTNAGECPFCYIARKTEEHAMDFVLGHGASYMEADIREMTDREGFCQSHFKKMFDYGNALGNAWILKTMFRRYLEEFDQELKNFKPDAVAKPKRGLFKKNSSTAGESGNSIVSWLNRRNCSCFICKMVGQTFDAYMNTFFELYRKDESFRRQVSESKGFCLEHLNVIMRYADEHLQDPLKSEFYQVVLPQTRKNLERIYGDISWFIEKFDYKNQDADWKNSKDAVQRGMQKLKGSDPSHSPHVMKK